MIAESVVDGVLGRGSVFTASGEHFLISNVLRIVNPTRRGLWNGHQEGGLLKPAPVKTCLGTIFDPIFGV